MIAEDVNSNKNSKHRAPSPLQQKKRTTKQQRVFLFYLILIVKTNFANTM